MTRLVPRIWRRWYRIGLALAAVGLAGAGLAWATREPWPIRASFPLPDGSTERGFAADGRSFLTEGPAEDVTAWDLATGRPSAGPGPRTIWRPTPAGDPRRCAGVVDPGTAESAVVWFDSASGEIRARFPTGGLWVADLRVGPGDRSLRAFLAGAGRGFEVATWDLATGVEVRRAILAPEPSGFASTAVSPDGRLIADLDAARQVIHLWDVAADRPAGDLARAGDVARWLPQLPLFAPDGRTLVVPRSDNRAEVWDVPGRRLDRVVRLLPGHLPANAAAIAPDGRTLLAATGSCRVPAPRRSWALDLLELMGLERPSFVGEVAVVDLATGRTLARSRTSCIARYAPDGRSILLNETAGGYTVRATPRPAGN